MDPKFLAVIKDSTPATIVTVNGQPAHVVNTWSHYMALVNDQKTLLIPAAGMHSIETDFEHDRQLTIAVGSYKVAGTTGTGCGFHVHGTGEFVTSGPYWEQMHAKFDWIRAVLVVTIDNIEQKI
ncbi:pyridoxamine 5'-phosphate oxidase family protein [Lactiplantibacillus modestisalitolerans]|uniref:Pyridoxamine 5'-phosphate oxidase family protein n=1 Tax=Lactiplantibacillus modestisalitolerans TaxID=1457219 RepID=A0ABV5WWI5_9LACO|nr:pyridoxamine 5'-phosphate oxidase family protein [Lactiplantibacillus modestisalitolerans]